MLNNPTVDLNNIYRFSFTSQKTLPITKTNRLMLFEKIIPADCFVNCSKHTNIFCEGNMKGFLMVKQVVHVVTTVL
jgi:hypothetical protein